MYRFDADHSGEIDHEETIGIIECILDGKVPSSPLQRTVKYHIQLELWVSYGSLKLPLFITTKQNLMTSWPMFQNIRDRIRGHISL